MSGPPILCSFCGREANIRAQADEEAAICGHCVRTFKYMLDHDLDLNIVTHSNPFWPDDLTLPPERA